MRQVPDTLGRVLVAQSSRRRGGVCIVLALSLVSVPFRGWADERPRDIILILDVSQSIREAFPYVVGGIDDFLRTTGEKDTLTLATFGDGVHFVVRKRALSASSRAEIQATLATLSPTDRFTNITYAVDRGLSELITLGAGPGRHRELILITDGKHNPAPGGRFPVPSFDELREKARRIPAEQWHPRYIVLGGEYDRDLTGFVRERDGEALMLRHLRDPQLRADLGDALRTAWLPARVVLEAFHGGVLLERLGNGGRVPSPGVVIEEGDRLLLGPDGYALVRSEQGAVIGLAPETDWTLEQARVRAQSGEVRIRGGLARGTAVATTGDAPGVELGLAGRHGAIHAATGLLLLETGATETTVAAAEAGASAWSYAARTERYDPAVPDVRAPAAGPMAAPRDPVGPASPPKAIPGGSSATAVGLEYWSPFEALTRHQQAIFTGWRDALHGDAPLSEIADRILLARQPARPHDVVITTSGEVEGDVLSDDDAMIILQTDAGLRYFRRAEITAVSYAAFPPSSASVVEVAGVAEFRREERDGWRELLVGTKLRPGDALRTRAQSRVICTVAGHAVVTVRENTEVRVEDLRRDPNTGDSRVRMALDAGHLWSDVGVLASARSQYLVETPQAVSGVRGTVFSVLYDPATATTEVASVEGAVAVVPKTPVPTAVVIATREQLSLDPTGQPRRGPIVQRYMAEWEAYAPRVREIREQLEEDYPPLWRPIRAQVLPNRPSPQTVGARVTFTVSSPDAEPGEVEHEFALRGPSTEDEWRIVQPFSNQTAWTWNTDGAAGEYLLRVRSRRGATDAKQEAVGVVPFTVRRDYTTAALVGLGLLVVGGGAIGVAFQARRQPASQAAARLRIVEAPQGLPHSALEIPPLQALRWRQRFTIGRGVDCDLTLGDEGLARVQCRLRRIRLGNRLRAQLSVEPGAKVYLDGVLTPAGTAHALFHMTRIHLGEYVLVYDAGEPWPPLEVICRNGHIVRGAAAKADLLEARTLALRPQEPGMPPYVVQFGDIEQIRVYRTTRDDDWKQHHPGSDLVAGPLVKIWFAGGGTLTGRLDDANAAEQGRFRVYTDEAHGLDHILVVGGAILKVKVATGTERPPKFVPQREAPAAGTRSRLALAGPGPTAVGQREIEESIQRLHDERGGPPPAPEQPAVEPTEAPAPPEQEERYIHRRGKPRI